MRDDRDAETGTLLLCLSTAAGMQPSLDRMWVLALECSLPCPQKYDVSECKSVLAGDLAHAFRTASRHPIRGNAAARHGSGLNACLGRETSWERVSKRCSLIKALPTHMTQRKMGKHKCEVQISRSRPHLLRRGQMSPLRHRLERDFHRLPHIAPATSVSSLSETVRKWRCRCWLGLDKLTTSARKSP